jgi:hypothetical protein
MSSKNYQIRPPSQEKGVESLYRVIYIIDVNAQSALKAAKLTHQIMTDPDSILPVLQVMDCNGKITTIDLSKEK